MWLAILGNTPELSALELGVSWLGGQVVQLKHKPQFENLGGTVKLAEEWLAVPRSLVGSEKIVEVLKTLPRDRKLHFGISVYAGEHGIAQQVIIDYSKKLERLGIDWKKQLRQDTISARYVSSREPALSSVIVHKEHLLDQHTDFVFVLYKNEIIIGRTIAVQDYREFSENDYGRPARDHKSGMLPPKVARMMVNIAVGHAHQVGTGRDLSLPGNMTLLDPFCGSGTVIQEALQLGVKKVIGSDISKQCITDTRTNIQWAKLPEPQLISSDVLKLTSHLTKRSITTVVAEGYLGPTRPHQAHSIKNELETFYSKMFIALKPLLQPGARLVLALPAWRDRNQLQRLQLRSAWERAGYKTWHPNIIYGRPQATVVRDIHFLMHP